MKQAGIRGPCLVLGLALTFAVSAPAGEKPLKPKFTISTETTYVTKPVDKDGYIDYAAALNERLQVGVTPANNALVPLMQAFGPQPERARLPAEFWRLLGINELAQPGNYFRPGYSYMKDELKLDPNVFFDRFERVSERPWTGKHFPHFAAWLKANEAQLALVAEATKRSRYFHPVVPKEELASAAVPAVQKCREMAHVLVTRAMQRIGESQYDEAWQDLLACHRLGRSLARGGTLIEGLVGAAIDRIASDGDMAFLDNVAPDAKRWQTCIKDLQALPAFPELAEKYDVSQRYTMLDLLLQLDRRGLDSFGRFIGEPVDKDDIAHLKKILKNVDLDPILRATNRWFDRAVVALKEKDRLERSMLIASLQQDLEKLKPANGTTIKDWIAAAAAEKKPQAAAQRIADFFTVSMSGAAQKIQDSRDRSEQMHLISQVAFAIAAYHKENGRFPKKLDALAPKYLAKVPLDLFTGKDLVYRPEKNGFLIYSFGPNGIDEGGRWYDDDPPGDDPRVRLPLPPLKKE